MKKARQLSTTNVATVTQRIQDLAEIHGDRKATYGEDFLRIGPSLAAIFPEGVSLKTPEDFTRFALFCQAHGKLMRYGARFAEGGHPDSLDDLSVYAQLLSYADDLADDKQ